MSSMFSLAANQFPSATVSMLTKFDFTVDVLRTATHSMLSYPLVP